MKCRRVAENNFGRDGFFLEVFLGILRTIWKLSKFLIVFETKVGLDMDSSHSE